MHEHLLALMRCPFCGTRLSPVQNEALVRKGGRIESGVLGCECCAFPIVAGIPVLVADDATREAMHALEAGRTNEALGLLLGLDDGRRAAFQSLLGKGGATYREALAILSPDAEGTYFLYRFSDPTYLLAQGVLAAIGQQRRTTSGWVLDVCGGSGHLTRILTGLHEAAGASGAGTVLADLSFWKLWLASRFTSPACEPVCCDANHPLPFSRHAFSMVTLTDAFQYLWHKRLLADDLMRLVRPEGVLVMPHMHSALGDNFSAGMPLTPSAYADLFAPLSPRMFRDEDLLTQLLETRSLDLTRPVPPLECGTTPSVTLVASRRTELFSQYRLPAHDPVTGALIVNPLYRTARRGDTSTLTLTFPTPEYEEEFGECRRYLPDTLTVAADLTGPLDEAALRASLRSVYDDLRRRRVLIDAPLRYC